jgi:2-keto-3-deoxy-L-rhamnonate aldolase RhmA
VNGHLLATGPGPRIGTMLMELTSPGVGLVLKHGGCDFAIVDMEHSGLGFETAKAMVSSIRGAGLVALIKLRSKLAHDIALSCDIGADGVVVPHVADAGEARAVLEHMRYPPLGHRGSAFRMAHDDYAPGDVAGKLERTNRELVFLALIEDRTGLEDVEAIAQTPGVTGLCLGHTDMSVSLGVPGDLTSPAFVQAQERVSAACRAAGKLYCRAIGSLEEGMHAHRSGATLLLYSGDVWILQDALAQATDELRAACAIEQDGSPDQRPRQAI